MYLDILGVPISIFLVKVLFVFLLTIFMPITTISFFRFRLTKKELEYERIIALLGLQETTTNFKMPTLRTEYSMRSFILPVLFATFICFIGSLFLLMGGEIFHAGVGKANTIFLAGPHFGREGADVDAFQAKSLLVLTMAFSGGYVWSAQNIIRRLITADLTPGTYYSAAFRMLFAGMVALMLAFLLDYDSSFISSSLPVVAFLTGIFPDQALSYLREKVKIFSTDSRGEESHTLSLNMIEGMNAFHAARLSETGVDNAQNLAESNIIELLLKTPFTASQLIDWMAQAKLYVYFKSDLAKLRDAGIRNAFDLIRAGAGEGMLEGIAEITGLKLLTLQLVHNAILADKGTAMLMRFGDALASMGEG